MKPFDIELAKQGNPVCTRDGRAVRILCYDKIGNNYPIVTLIDKGEYEEYHPFTIDGKFHSSMRESDNDLFMAPVKKDGWVNVFTNYFSGIKSTDRIYSTKAEALKFTDTQSPRYIDTVKIEWEE